GDLRLLDVSQGVQEQLGADGALSGLPGIFLELFTSDVLGCEHLLEDLLVTTELADELLDLALHLLVNHGLRQRDLDLVQRGLEDLVADLAGLAVLQLLLDLGRQGVLELIQGVELGCQLREVVVQLRQLALLDGSNLDGDLCLFVGVLAGDQLGGVGGLLAGLHAGQGVGQTIDDGVVADFVRQARGGGLVHGLAVNGGGQVDGDEVALLDLAVNGLQGAEASLQVLQLALDGLVVGLDGVDFYGDVGEVWDLDLRTDVDLGGKGDGL